MYNPVGYTGQYADGESGLVYLRARYYDTTTQQFITQDPLAAKTRQAYGYTRANPINTIDPSGLSVQCAAVGAGVSIAAGAALTFYWCSASNGDTGLLGSVNFQGTTSIGPYGTAQFLWSDNANSLEDLTGPAVFGGGGLVITGKNGASVAVGHSPPATTCAVGVFAGPNVGTPLLEAHGGLRTTNKTSFQGTSNK
jgi:RHS repeat-associated protein